jgi:hypothetical protein
MRSERREREVTNVKQERGRTQKRKRATERKQKSIKKD